MQESENSPEPAPSAVGPVKKKAAAWWCWPLILFSLVPAGWIAKTLNVPEAEAPSSGAVAADPAELAILKLQSQVIIASQRFDPGKVDLMLDDLSEMAAGPGGKSALALVEHFVAPEGNRASNTISELPAERMPETTALLEKAVSDGIDEAERIRLAGSLGDWFASLAPAPGGLPSPSADQIKRGAVIVFAMAMLFSLCAVTAVAIGAGLVIWYAVRLRSGETANSLRVDGGHDGYLLECFALYLGVMTFGGIGAIWVPSLAVVSYALAVIVPLAWPFVRKVSWKEFLVTIGWHRGKGWLREIGAGVVGYFGVLSIASIGIAMTTLLILISGAISGDGGGSAAPGPEPHPIVGWIFEGGIWAKLACLFLAAVFAPLFEEVFFRGMLHRYLRGRFAFFSSALIGGIIFAALHPQGVYAIPALAAMGVGFALLREWRDSLIAPMVAHSINNGLLVMALWMIL